MAGSDKYPKAALEFGGLNVREHPFDLKPGEFSVLTNLNRTRKALETRLGHESAINKMYNNIFAGVRRMFRYRNSAGVKKNVLYSGGAVWADSDDKNFDSLVAFAANDDGYAEFLQYRDTLLISSENEVVKAYNPDNSPAAVAPSFYPLSFTDAGTQILDATTATTGGFLEEDRYYYWRVTFDVQLGGDFLGEMSSSLRSDGTSSQYYKKQWTGGTGENKITFNRPSDAIVDAIPAYVKRVNFYRSVGYGIDPWPRATQYNSVIEDPELYYIGSVDMATVRAETAGNAIFVDDGSVAPGKQISYGIRWYGVKARHTAFFKGRLWAQNVAIRDNAAAAYVDYPNAIIYSRYWTNQEEPLVFQSAAPKIFLDKYTGEGGSGMAVWQGKVLLAFTPRSTSAIIGGDDFISSTLPDIQREVLSDTIGCIAPRTIVNYKGRIMWLSHEGFQMFSGRGGPVPVGSYEILALLDAIPADRRRKAHSYIDSAAQEYVTFISDPTHPTANRVAIRYSFVTGLWTSDRRKRGVGAAVEINESDQLQRVLYGYDDSEEYFNTQFNESIVVKANTGFLEGISEQHSQDTDTIDWRGETGYLDHGVPLSPKKVLRVSVEGEWSETFQLDFRTAGTENPVDTEAGGGTLQFEAPVGGKGIRTVLVSNDRVIEGQLIQYVVRGVNDSSQTKITKIVPRLEIGPEKTEASI